MYKRDDFSETVKRELAARVGNLCSNPTCRALTTGPREESTKVVNLGVAAHITAAAPGGERYDPTITADERAAPRNAVWLCQNCAKLIDSDSVKYTSSLILRWKAEAEAEAAEKIGKSVPRPLPHGDIKSLGAGPSFFRASSASSDYALGFSGEILAKLKRLTVSQFDEIVYSLDIDASYLPSSEAALAKRAIELCKLLEQHEGGLEKIGRKLDELGWFKKLLPRGAHPVDSGLQDREEGKERLRMARALATGEVLDQCSVSPKQFYSLHEQVGWIAVFRNWDAPRSFRDELRDRALECAELPNVSLSAAIIGPGGSGKSIALRRLAIDLLEQGRKVWWIDDFHGFLQEGLWRIAEHTSEVQYILLDKVELYGDDLGRLLAQAKEHKWLKFVFAGREMSSAVRWPMKGVGLFEPDEGADRVCILRKIAELVPEWAGAARQLEAEPLLQARLICTLFALSRLDAIPATVDEIHESFVAILADDARRAGSAVPGLMEAIVDAAVLHEVGVEIDHPTLVMLAERHHAGAHYLLDELVGNERWMVVRPLMSCGLGNKWRFHHDELVHGLLAAGSVSNRQLGPQVLVDNAWRRRLMSWILEAGAFANYSLALYGFARYRPDVFSPEEVVARICKLADSGCEHYAYFEIAALKELQIDSKARYDLLLRLADVTVPGNCWLWSAALRWTQSNCSQEKRSDLARLIIAGSCRKYGRTPSNILVNCLKMMSLGEAREHARKLISTSDEHEVVRICFNLLGDEALEEARRLILVSEDHDVLCACLKLLGKEAKGEARHLLNTSKDHEVVTTCLKLLGSDAKGDARRLLKEVEEGDILCACLRILGDEAKEDARRLLTKYSDGYVAIVCLRMLGKEAMEEARRIVLVSRLSSVQCLCLKILGSEGKAEARLLLKQSRRSDVLCVCLNMLGDEAKDDARRFLATPGTRVEVLNRSFAILGEEALGYAVTNVVNWRSVNVNLVACCLGVAWRTREARFAALEMLKEWDTLSQQLRVPALATPMREPLRLVRAEKVVAKWRSERRMLVAAALNAYGEKPVAVTNVCRSIIQRWRSEIEEQRARREERHDVHIVKAMSHPMLRAESRVVAQEMLEALISDPELLTEDLKECAQNIARNRFVSWAQEQRSVMRR